MKAEVICASLKLELWPISISTSHQYPTNYLKVTLQIFYQIVELSPHGFLQQWSYRKQKAPPSLGKREVMAETGRRRQGRCLSHWSRAPGLLQPRQPSPCYRMPWWRCLNWIIIRLPPWWTCPLWTEFGETVVRLWTDYSLQSFHENVFPEYSLKDTLDCTENFLDAFIKCCKLCSSNQR